ncbi:MULTISPECIES: YlxM family DNA-binding protein [Oscillospiraceae]|uniref:YlxM family DNA-binding protein n=1 Tax=Oscillospiraceae TaxID=216572 RepID=UPI000B396A5D|nr:MULTISPECIES: sigma factor-like helix-turn-helix DNA-binding protein [Oscillospiraceae]MBM6724606.1 DNA-binding protein [Pseudoflavonifractor phocaeensis]OUO36874.1 DNA-binding protein [Flavonifractor sp. An306]HJC00779.1 DNA-binding protein [Candidatus Flavonifractor merdavium]
MKNQAYRMALLYDFYGDMLTDRQKEFYDLYYNEDLSLAEIAENYGITRQGVRDVIVRAEAVLTELEDKTGIIRRFHKMQEQFAQMETAVNAILQRNDQKWQDNELELQCNRIQELLAQLKQE